MQNKKYDMLAPLSDTELQTINGGFCLAPLSETIRTIQEAIERYKALSDEAKESLRTQFPLLSGLFGIMAPFW